jgi:hypothetical protein
VKKAHDDPVGNALAAERHSLVAIGFDLDIAELGE